MSSFDYLSVLISIVLGLSIANVLTGLVALVRHRRRASSFWPLPMWMVTLFLIHIQTWWALFGLRATTQWSFAAFLVVLLQPVALFVMAALIVPELSASGDIDLRGFYFRVALVFWRAVARARGQRREGARADGRATQRAQSRRALHLRRDCAHRSDQSQRQCSQGAGAVQVRSIDRIHQPFVHDACLIGEASLARVATLQFALCPTAVLLCHAAAMPLRDPEMSLRLHDNSPAATRARTRRIATFAAFRGVGA